MSRKATTGEVKKSKEHESELWVGAAVMIDTPPPLGINTKAIEYNGSGYVCVSGSVAGANGAVLGRIVAAVRPTAEVANKPPNDPLPTGYKLCKDVRNNYEFYFVGSGNSVDGKSYLFALPVPTATPQNYWVGVWVEIGVGTNDYRFDNHYFQFTSRNQTPCGDVEL